MSDQVWCTRDGDPLTVRDENGLTVARVATAQDVPLVEHAPQLAAMLQRLITWVEWTDTVLDDAKALLSETQPGAPAMTLEDFRATKRQTEDLGKALRDSDERLAGKRGFLYCDSYYVIDEPASYCVEFLGDTFYSPILADAEAYLYGFAKAQGVIPREEGRS